MIKILWKQVYETNEFNDKQWILILYDISANHYVGLPVYSKKQNDSIYLESINKYVIPSEIKDYNRSKMIRPIYKNGKPIKVVSQEFQSLFKHCKFNVVRHLEKNIENGPDGISYAKWCKYQLLLNNNSEIPELKQNSIYWVNLGYNIGSELRKIRPAILWRSSKDKSIWTIIPLSTKCNKDNYYFHVDLECIAEGTAKIESLMNYSYKRIIEPYFSNGTLAILTNKDYKNISKAISQFYLFR